MWYVCQIGAREHYAIPRALHRQGELATLVSDFWIPPSHPLNHLPRGKRLGGRFHSELKSAAVLAPNIAMIGFELRQRLRKRRGWSVNMKRNTLFQQKAISMLSRISDSGSSNTLFCYSYAAGMLFHFAKQHDWRTVLGQIDPGPEEERIVAAEHLRYPNLGSRWQPVPQAYWDSWREELDLADVIIVNSEWSRQCLLKEGVSLSKIEIIPLVYQYVEDSLKENRDGSEAEKKQNEITKSFQVLFLGQINLRKGIGRLLDAMKLLKDEPITLTLAGPSEIDISVWEDLLNVVWIGSVPRNEVGACYQNADVFILPTLSDGYALTQLEALARGVPVIASKHCGEAVEDGVNGWILEDLEPATIAKAILKARSSPLENVSPPLGFGIDQLGERMLAVGCGR